MRFEKLDLLRYGALTDTVLAFRPGARLHVVYGPNEAGKSSALSAISDLLFGFPDKAAFNFQHDLSSLRVGGSIAARDGREMAFRRRRGRKNTLLAATEAEEPLAEDALSPFMGTLSRDVFRRAFGLDSASLRAGGETMLKSGGEIGALLFSAASGLTGLSNLRKSLDSEADAIYAPRRAKDRSFYQALDLHDEARRAERENELRAGDWKKIVGEQAELEAAAEDLRRQREETRRELDRLRRLLQLEPLLREIDRHERALSSFSHLVDADAAFADDTAALLMQSSETGRHYAASEEEIARLKQDLGDVSVNAALLDAMPRIMSLHADKGAYLKFREDIARVRGEVDEFDTRLRQAASRLGLTSADELEVLQPSDADLVRLRALVDQGTALERDLKQSSRRLSEEQDALSRLNADASGQRLIDPKPWSDQFAALRPDLAELAGLESQTIRLSRAESDLSAAIARLDPPVRDAALLMSLPLPELSALSAQRQAIETAKASERQFEHALAVVREDLQSVLTELGALEGEGRIVSRQAIGEARLRRDGLLVDAGEVAVIAILPSLRQAIDEADRLADAALADAERVSRHAQLTLRRRDMETRLATAEQELKAARIAVSDAGTEFEDLFHAVPVTVAAPERMIEWRRSVDGLAALVRAREEARDALDILRLKAEAVTPSLAAIADAIGLTIGSLPIRGIARDVERRLEELSQHWNERRSLLRLQSAAADNVRRFEEEKAGLTSGIERWRDDFLRAAGLAGLPEDASIEMAMVALDLWRTVPGLMVERENRNRRVRGMGREMENFERLVTALCTEVAPDLADLPADAAVSLLHDRANEMRDSEGRRASLAATLARNEAALSVVKDKAEQVQVRLGEAAARVSTSVKNLPDVVGQLRMRAASAAALRDGRDRFAEQCDGMAEAEARQNLTGFDRLAAELRIEELAAEDERQVEQMKANGIAVAGVERRRLDLESGLGAERAAFQRLSAEEQARDLARRWVVLKLASHMLSTSMESYREQQADPVMRRAGALFRDLTGGRFARLVQAYDDQDQLELAAQRRNGDVVPLQGLSEGTGDQLYLALRLAFIEDYCIRNEPAPLILDDIFQTFDDERTTAGLKALADAGETFQTILFTHQKSLVEAARDALGDGLDIVSLDGH